MQAQTLPRVLATVGAALLLGVAPVGAEVIEEIVAWVEGDIITMSDLQREEQAIMEELYRRYTGEELDRQVREARATILLRMIEHKLLLHRAEQMFVNIDDVGNAYLEMFKEQQQITTDEELQRMLAQGGMTVDGLKRHLIDRYAPSEIIRMEVGNRIAVGDKEVADYYETHKQEFEVSAKVTFREIVLLADGEDMELRRAEAEAIRERAIAPETDFAELAKEVSEAGTAAAGGLLGPLERGELSRQLAEVAFGLQVGEISEVLDTPYGFHILRIEELREQRVRSLDEVREDVRRQLEDQKYQEDLDAFLKKLLDEANWRVNGEYQHRLPSPPTGESGDVGPGSG